MNSYLILYLSSFLLYLGFNSTLFAQNVNLIKNGKFEQDIKDWEILKNVNSKVLEIENIERSKAYSEYGLADNYIGLSFVELDAKSAIQQTIPTREGENYVLAFAFAHRQEGGDCQMSIIANGKPIYIFTVSKSRKNGFFQQRSLVFKASAQQTTLGFYCVPLNGEKTKGILITDILCGKESEIDLDLHYSY